MDEPRRQHDVLQSQYFDKLAEYFYAQSIPQAVRRRARQIVRAGKIGSRSCVLDVGTGVGFLIEYLLEVGVKPENIVACDLSKEMLARARKRYPGIYFWCGDILDFPDGLFAKRPEGFPQQITSFDAIFFNGCFGNIWNQHEAIDVSVKMLFQGGRIVISHPLGKEFVSSLHKNEPEIVPHLLPNNNELINWANEFGLRLQTFLDEPNLYLTVLKKENSSMI